MLLGLRIIQLRLVLVEQGLLPIVQKVLMVIIPYLAHLQLSVAVVVALTLVQNQERLAVQVVAQATILALKLVGLPLQVKVLLVELATQAVAVLTQVAVGAVQVKLAIPMQNQKVAMVQIGNHLALSTLAVVVVDKNKVAVQQAAMVVLVVVDMVVATMLEQT
jgi:hypothetical protein